MTPTVYDILKYNGPMLSSSIIKIYEERFGLSSTAARKRVSRAVGSVKRLSNVTFPKNQKFLYLEKQFAKEQYISSLIKELLTAKSVLGVACYGLISKGGRIPKSHFAIISGAPERRKKHLAPNKVLDSLRKLGLINYSFDLDGKEYVELRGVIEDSFINSVNSDVVANIILEALSNWIKSTGIGSFKSIKTSNCNNTLPDFGSFKWDLTAPSSILPISKISKDGYKPGFVTADVSYGKRMGIEDVQFFIRKCDSLRALKSTNQFLSIMLAESFTTEAFNELKKKGIMAVTPGILFGNEIARSLSLLLDTLNRAAEIAAGNPEKIATLIDSLSKIEGASGNLRGALFELIVGHLVKDIEKGYIEIGKKIKVQRSESIERAEIDVIRVNGKHVDIYECKGKNPGVKATLKEVERWLEQKVPIIRGALKQEGFYSDKSFAFNFWVTTEFDDEALKYLQEKKRMVASYSINWKTQREIKEYIRGASNSSIRNTLNEHFFKHPLSD